MRVPETPAKIELRRLEVHVAVEMEAAAVAAVAAFEACLWPRFCTAVTICWARTGITARGRAKPRSATAEIERRVGRPANPHAQLDLTLVSVSDR